MILPKASGARLGVYIYIYIDRCVCVCVCVCECLNKKIKTVFAFIILEDPIKFL